MELTVTFPGGKRVDASYNGYTIKTDQPVRGGGEGSAPAPFDLFLASIGTCAGIYVQGFCQSRGLSSENIRIVQKMNFNPQTRMIDTIDLAIHLPSDFPEKYRDAVVNAAELCAVKKHLMHPPAIKVSTEKAESEINQS